LLTVGESEGDIAGAVIAAFDGSQGNKGKNGYYAHFRDSKQFQQPSDETG